MKVAERNLKVVLVDASPKMGRIGGDKLIAASGLLTSEKGSLLEKVRKLEDRAVEEFHRESTRRGHASLLTTPTLYFWMQGSRMIDFFFTAFPFGSYLMFSSRRIPVEERSLLVPSEVANSRLSKRYERVSLRMLRAYRESLREAKMDFARCLLPLGFSSYGFFSFPLQTLLTAYHESSRLGENVPKEIRVACERLSAVAKEHFPMTLSSAALGGKTGFTFPNVFGESRVEERRGVKVVYLHDDLPRVLRKFKRSRTKDYRKLVSEAHDKILVRVVDEVSLAAWNEIKRHRTVRQRVESVYSAARRRKFYPVDRQARKEYGDLLEESVSLYEDLISEGIGRGEAAYILPHALKVRLVLLLDGYHLFSPFGFFGVRLCSTAYAEVRELCERTKEKVVEELPEADGLIEPKCKLGVCPERKSCGYVKKFLG